MQAIINYWAVAVIMALSVFTTAYASPAGTQIYATGLAQGGSEVTFTWPSPVASTYKIWVQIPLDGTTTNAPYRVYPLGNPLGGSECSSTDALAPCYEVPVNQFANRAKWVQLVLKNNPSTTWQFTKSGFVSVNASSVNPNHMLSAAAVSFEDTSLKIGKKYGGGMIFYLDASKQHGLIAALTDQSTGIQWYNGSNFSTGATATVIGRGAANTQQIVFRQGVGQYAAQLCDDLVIGAYNDWFLLSKDELNLMYKNIGPGAADPLKNVGGFASAYYWSSSEDDGGYSAWYQYFGDGSQSNDDRNYADAVRAVRAF